MNSDGTDQSRIKTTNAVNSVLFLLVWTFTAVCRADGDVCSLSCENVTGTVGEEVTFTCSVSQKRSECCFKMYKFQYPEKYNNLICRQDLPEDSCEQRNSFTCRYTPATAMTGQFRFFLQTIKCGPKNTEFTVNITEPIKPAIITEAPETPSPVKVSHTESIPEGIFVSVACSVAGCVIIIIIIIIMTIIYKRKPNYSTPCGFQRRMFLCLRQDDDNSNFQQQSPQNEINITDSTV